MSCQDSQDHETGLIPLIGRFGNFIGEAEESEEESQHEDLGASAYVYEDEPEEDVGTNNQQLMELDGGFYYDGINYATN